MASSAGAVDALKSLSLVSKGLGVCTWSLSQEAFLRYLYESQLCLSQKRGHLSEAKYPFENCRLVIDLNTVVLWIVELCG